MQVFCDESYSSNSNIQSPHSTLVGVAIPLVKLRSFSREMFNLKKEFFDVTELADFEIKGHKLLNRNKFKNTNSDLVDQYFEFIREVFGLCHRYEIKLFSVTLRMDGKEDGLKCKTEDDLRLPIHYQFLLERINQHVKESSYISVATLVFDQMGQRTDRNRSAAFTNYMYKNVNGQRFAANVSIIPYFVDSSVSEGVQVADLLAYIVNSYREGRVELKEFFDLASDLQFKSIGRNMFGFRYKRKMGTAASARGVSD
ncbi:hypothetical protein BMS3Bbin04_00655 [bacterium BMS3Bbin04]|nr:hypothetical protein BMS3Bbin04_00655 [bacterium BMS3Bbin04]